MGVSLTSSLIEALLGNINVGFEGLLVTNGVLSLSLPVVRPLSLGHPVLLGYYSLGVTVIVIYLHSIHNTQTDKLWEVWYSGSCSVHITQ